ncbi:MAG: D-alanyl-D-alanine carboxypeptidase [Pseudomonadota bacterium]
MIDAGRFYRRWAGVIVCCLGLAWMGWPSLVWCAAGIDFPQGGKDAVVISLPDGAIAFSANADTALVPASILKLLTALVAIDTLGTGYRFPTDFSTTEDGRLLVKGYGDPLFISEAIDVAAMQLVKLLPSGRRPCLSGISLDKSYFVEPLLIPGVNDTDNPYDAPNGALCANFNTVFFTRNPLNGRLETAEPQTPLLPFAEERIGRYAEVTDRVVLSHHENDATRYAGHLLRFFLESHGCNVSGNVDIVPKTPPPPADFAWRFSSPYTVTMIIQRMMTYSNNFMANQLLIASAAAAYGPPGNLAQGARLARAFADKNLGLKRLVLVEGSGISRDNRISAADMHRVLGAFYRYRHLLRKDGDDAFKTGTLDGIRTRAGYFTVDGKDYGYVVMLNSDTRRMDAVMQAVRRHIRGLAATAAGRP